VRKGGVELAGLVGLGPSATSLLLERDLNPDAVQAMGVWSNQSIVRRVYAHVSLARKRRAAAVNRTLAGLGELPATV
jgi:hypothetical protein